MSGILDKSNLTATYTTTVVNYNTHHSVDSDTCNIITSSSDCVDLSNKNCIELQTLHRRLGHASSLVIKKVVSLYKPNLSINKDFNIL